MRWIEAKWSPDSRFLAAVDHYDGHMASVYVFGVKAGDAAQPRIALYYQTPGPPTYDVKWDLVGWRLERSEIILSRQVRHQETGRTTKERVVARLGSAPIR